MTTWGFWAFLKERTQKPSAKRVAGLLLIIIPLAGWLYIVIRTQALVDFGPGHITVIGIGAGLVGAAVMLERLKAKTEPVTESRSVVETRTETTQEKSV